MRKRLYISALLTLAALMARGQDDPSMSFRSMLLATDGVVNPTSPEVAAMHRYGQNEVNLYRGVMETTIPAYNYSDADFNLPIILSYSFDGYKPNTQSGVLGQGWYLNCGGSITRKVCGIPDESSPNTTEGVFRDKWIGYIYNDEYLDFDVYGYAFWCKDTTLTINNAEEDYEYSGRSGEEYFRTFHPYTSSLSNYRREAYETEPDIFTFIMPGHKGSFILDKESGVRFFNTTGPSSLYQLDYILGYGPGFLSFTITTPEGYQYTFSSKDLAHNVATNISDDGIWKCGAWQLDSIEAPNGRVLEFHRDIINISQTFSPEYLRDNNYRVSRNGLHDISGENNQQLTSYTYTSITEVESKLITSITTSDGTLDARFHYSQKKYENGSATSLPYFKLDSIKVYSLFGECVKTCRFEYTTTGQAKGLTFLSSAYLSGEGQYSFHYSLSSLQTPNIDTREIDWYGFWNGHSGDFLDDTVRRPDSLRTCYGAMRRIDYPTGGFMTIDYDLNTYYNDVSGDDISQNISKSTAGSRVKSMTLYESESNPIRKKSFEYITSDGKSSGTLLWRTLRYCNYNGGSSSFPIIQRSTISTASDMPYSSNPHVDYSRVLETIIDMHSQEQNYTINEYIFETASNPLVKGWYNEYESSVSTEAYLRFVFSFTPDSLTHSQAYKLSLFEQSNMRGRLKSKTEFAQGDFNHPIRKILNTYQYISQQDIQIPSRAFCYSMTHRIPTDIIYKSQEEILEYASAPSSDVISSKTTVWNLDSLGRNSSVAIWDSDGVCTYLDTEYDESSGKMLPKVQTEYKNGYITDITKYEYINPNGNLYLLSEKKKGIINLKTEDASDITDFDTILKVEKYDAFGNPLQYIGEDGIRTALVWGNAGSTMVASVRGAYHNALNMGDTPLQGNLSQSQKNSLTEINGALTTIWTHKPLVGITELMDPSGRTLSYEYDSVGRLSGCFNSLGQQTQRYIYNTVTESTSATLSQVHPSINKNFILSQSIGDNGNATNVDYYDGLGRKIQNVIPDSDYIHERVKNIEYDYLDHPVRAFLSEGIFNIHGAGSYKSPEINEDDYPFTQTEYENSDSGRIINERMPGTAFHVHPKTWKYISLSEEEVTNYVFCDANGSIENNGYYSPGVLKGVVVTDGDGRQKVTWSTHQGKLICEDRYLVENGDTTIARTQYVYNWKDQLVWVLSPKAVQIAQENVISPESTLAKGLCYLYGYDSRGRLAWKKIPGKEKEEYTYDQWGRLIGYQDGNMRQSDKRIITIYDALGRESEIRLEDDDSDLLLRKNYYDTPYDFGDELMWCLDDECSTQTKGLKTAEKVNILGTNSYRNKTWHYDRAGNVLQYNEYCPLTGIYLAQLTRYDIQGNLLENNYETNSECRFYDSLKTEYEYDSQNRVTYQQTIFNMDYSNAYSAYFGYDYLGRMNYKRVVLDSEAGGDLVTILTYTPQNWPLSKCSTIASSRIYYDEITYEDCPYPGQDSYSGNISSYYRSFADSSRVTWPSKPGQFFYYYDSMDRVIDAPQYRETGELTELSHRDIKYDINGNILSYYMGCDMVNDTHDTLNYSGNQASIFMYDANGNVSHIIAEDISIEYNILNLMSRVTYLTESGMYGTMPILYDFDGAKVQQDLWQTHYIGPFRYSWQSYEEDDDYLSVHTYFDGGHFDANHRFYEQDQTYSMIITLKDYLNNTKAELTSQGQIYQYNNETDYAPYGHYSNGFDTYLFCGKEQIVLGGDHHDFGTYAVYDFDNRYYNSVNFLNIDPLSEKSYGLSPYSFAANNPLKYTDYAGLDTLVLRYTENKWVIDKFIKSEGVDVINVRDKNGQWSSYDYSHSYYGNRVNMLNIETEDSMKGYNLGVYFVSGSNAYGYYLTPGGESSNAIGSNSRINDGIYNINAPESEAKWQQPGVSGNGVDKRGIRFHPGTYRGSSEGCFILSTDYDYSTMTFTSENSREAVKQFNYSLGASDVKWKQGERQKAIFPNKITHKLQLKSMSK